MDLTYDKYQNSNPNNIVNDDLLNKIKELIKKKPLYLNDKETRLKLYEELDNLFKDNHLKF